jgi:release factor glutamine methyltransferase
VTISPQLKAGASLSEAAKIIAESLRCVGVETPEVDTRVLLGCALRLKRTQLLAQSNRLLEQHDINAIFAVVSRRLKREPVSRILGCREFWDLMLQVTPDVFDPRPDTETLVEAVLDFVTRSGWHQRRIRILDIGTGSGAILLSLLSELPHAVGIATDISQAAIAVARVNAEHHGLLERCNFIVCNIAEGVRGRFDVIVTNPPYVRRSDIKVLEPEVRDYDPIVALDGSEDGLQPYRAIAQQGKNLLALGGRLFVELGEGQESAVSELLIAAGLAVVAIDSDLAGIPRALIACVPDSVKS